MKACTTLVLFILLCLKIFSEKNRKKMSQTAARAAQVDKIKNQMMQV
jgi:hypothetical protein